jgi:hypothetical protein
MNIWAPPAPQHRPLSRFQYSGSTSSTPGMREGIGNDRGRIDGWVKASGIFGRLVRVDPSLDLSVLKRRSAP